MGPQFHRFIRASIRIGLRLFAALCLISIGLTLPLAVFNPPTTAFILQDSGDQPPWLTRWTPLEAISAHLPLAVVASEDQRFPDHFGIDVTAIRKALNENREQLRGGSTISQQLAKNLYLWPGRSLLRKGIEAWLTLWMELFWTKTRLLEIYLNVVEFGPGIYGVTEASHHFFNKTPAQLSAYEASLLAAVLPNPKRLNVSQPSAYVSQRSRTIRTAMSYLGGHSYLEGILP
ncbi:monofunctional biosynthetic peptidoglycan transglycosylase [Saccharospirillum impatiens]|uniref:monofunctional biosynthetic peptidoglycan transglycosylase n=1 Tax=Saccharospirillum impatiens TaxID=169438 RepID=UPI0003F577B7|nr:monofunctional biosynthetic peptidoglycan transglycosylase [Saccharospirillum impatiens]